MKENGTSMNNKYKLSILIPSYNNGDNLLRAVESCFNATLPKLFEIIICDNRSTDRSIDKINKLNIENIRVHVNDYNIGRVDNWNKCIESANSEYIYFLFANDVIDSNCDFCGAISTLDYTGLEACMFNVKYEINDNSHIAPEFDRSGIINAKRYLKLMFLDYCKFTALGIPQQYIFNLNAIRSSMITFDRSIPRTADRVFIYEVIKRKNEFLYIDSISAVWKNSDNRFHNKVHLCVDQLSYERVWGEEYRSNSSILSREGCMTKKIDNLLFSYAVWYLIYSYFLNMKNNETLLLPKFISVLSKGSFINFSYLVFINFFCLMKIALLRLLDVFPMFSLCKVQVRHLMRNV